MHATEILDSSLLRADVDGSNPSANGQSEIPETASGAPPLAGPQLEIPEAASGAPRNSKPKTTTPAARRRWQKFVRRGRPSTFNEEVADAMYESILEAGVSDSRAGLLANVSTSTVSRWKLDDPNFAEFLEIARSKFEFAELKKIRNAKRRDGQPNAQNAKWLLQHTNPEVWGGRASKRSGNAASRSLGASPAVRSVLAPDIDHDTFSTPQQSKIRQNIPENAPTDAPSCVIPCERPLTKAVEGTRPNDQRPSPQTSCGEPSNEPASCSSRTPFVDPNWEANLAENEALRDAVIAEIAELESARFRAAQQSKSLPSIPVIPPGKVGVSLDSPSVRPSNLGADLEAILARRRKEQKALSRTSR